MSVRSTKPSSIKQRDDSLIKVTKTKQLLHIIILINLESNLSFNNINLYSFQQLQPKIILILLI